MNSYEILDQIAAIIQGASTILITGQGNPDGDSVGAELALHDIISQQRQPGGSLPEIVICNDDPVPPHYDFFPNIGRIQPVEQTQGRRFEVGFVVDSGTSRLQQVLPLLQTCQRIINIDHHQSRAAGIETLAWIEPQISSVCEMVYGFFEHPAWRVALTPDIAACLYAGMIYDTGVFRYPNTTPRTLEVAGKLIGTGIDFARIVEQLLLEKRLSALRLLAAVLDSVRVNATGEVIWGRVTQDMLRRAGATFDDEEGMISQFAFTKGTKVAALFKEFGEQMTKISFRSRGALDVGNVAKSLTPQGGGHDRAAGCTMHTPLIEAERAVIAALERALAQPS